MTMKSSHLLQGDTVMSRSMFFLTELYSLKHQARLTMDTLMEKICAVSIPLSAKSILRVPSLSMETESAKRWMMLMMEGKMM